MHLSTAFLAKSAASALTGTGLVAASVLGLHSAAGTDADRTSTAASHTDRTPRCGPLHVGGKHAPEQLRADVKEARQKLRDSDATGADKRAERRTAVSRIRDGLADGTYGAKLEERATKRGAAAEERRADRPAQLRTDLAALKKMDAGASRKAAAAKIREARLAGSYGAEVKERAVKHQARKDACQEQRQDRKESKDSGS